VRSQLKSRENAAGSADIENTDWLTFQ
jgi:hypothetical protein